MAMEEVDDDFLSQVASLEAQALLTSASKRRKIATSPPPTEEGVYTAVLRGSRSLVFQQLSASSPKPLPPGGGKAGHCVSGGDVAEKTCPCGVGVCVALTANTERNRGRKFYKCPLREENGGCGFFEWCDKNTEAAPITVKSQSYASNTGGVCVGGDDVAEKACPCGVGVCVALTANTEKNRGRKFYKCPLREENGGCGFFEWCDKNTEAEPTTAKSESYVSNTSASDLSCPCGAGVCLMLTAKTGKNIGQQFYRCPANQAMSCGFFKWCHEHKTSGDTFSFSANASTTYKTNTTSQHIFPKDNGSSCFKCGKDGHWARDCTFSVSASTTYTPGKPNQKNFANSSGSSCYKYGKDGH